MVASIDHLLRSYSTPKGGECIAAGELLVQHPDKTRIENAPFLASLDITKVKVRLATVQDTLQVTGCTPEQARIEIETRIEVLSCPKDPIQRCEGCIENYAKSRIDHFVVHSLGYIVERCAVQSPTPPRLEELVIRQSLLGDV